MVFRRRDRRSIWRAILEFVWPRGGWGRAARYVQHRVRRLPDTPEKIARGIWAGVFTAFTPFYGLHFVVAAVLAMVMRGNVLASLMGTFFGNPLTYVPIGVISLRTGHWLLGGRFDHSIAADAPGGRGLCNIGCQFGRAFNDLWQNFKAIFTSARMDWQGLANFYQEVFLPYLVGGILPGIVAATICYMLAVPMIRVYQNRRRKKLSEKLAQLKKPADGGAASR